MNEAWRDHGYYCGFEGSTASAELETTLSKQLAEKDVLITELEKEKESQHLQLEELMAEVTLLRAKLKRADVCGERGATQTLVSSEAPLSPLSTTISSALPVPTTIAPPTVTSALTTTTPPTGWSALTTGLTFSSTSTSTVLAPMLSDLMTTTPRSSMGGGISTYSPPTVTPLSTGVPSTTVPAVPLSAHAPAFDPKTTTSSLMTTPTMPTIRPPVVAFSPSTSLLGQLPPIQRFTGEDAGDGETFQEWHEQFESVAQLVGWTDQGKLVNLTTRLKGTAYSFYRSCSPEQRNSYPLLVVELKRRFTPVWLTAIQTQLFHDRQQGAKETVDDYAQALQKLYKNAYSGVLRGGTEAEEMGQTVLANQFVARLRPDLKTRVVGTEGKLEQLLLKARFEEAKQRFSHSLVLCY